MSVRVYPAGYEFLDPVAMSSTAGSGLIIDDGTRTAPWVDRPGQQRSDLFLNQSLRRWMTTPREELLAIRPPLPPIPPPWGYRTEELTLDDVVANQFSPVRRDPRAPYAESSVRNSLSATI